MHHLVIAIDCDDVLIASTEYLVKAYNDKFQTRVTLARAHEPNNEEWGTEDKKLVLERLSDLQKSEEYGVLVPSAEAIAAVRELAKEHELHLITARNQSVEAVTKAMLDTYLKDCFTTVEHVGQDRSKGDVCQKIHADVLIDDNLRHLVSALESGVPQGHVFHFGAYPWNKSTRLSDGVVHCGGWPAVLERVDEIAGR